MSWLDAVRFRIGALLRPAREARDLEREMTFHLELDTAQRRHRAGGDLTEDDARFAARRDFGNVTYLREEARRVTASAWLDARERDLRFAARGVRRSPGFAIAVVLTLALGIGANAAMFALIDRMLLRPPPRLIAPERVHRVYAATTVRGQERIGGVGAYARYVDLKNGTSSFDRFAAFTENDLAVGIGDASREMRVGLVSASFFGFFDAPPAFGRYFTDSEDVPGQGAHVAVASNTEWQTAYGGRPDILGTKVQIGQDVYEIVGVASPGFVGLWPNEPPAYFVPIATAGDQVAKTMLRGEKRNWWATYHFGWLDAIARTSPGVSEVRANADLTQALVSSVEAERVESPDMPPTSAQRPRAVAASILTERGPRASGFAKVAAWLGGVAVIVLLIACANVANLLLARTLRRRREMALRLALGAGRKRLFWQLATESLLLVFGGGLAGLLVAQWANVGLRLAFLPGARPLSVLTDARTILFAGAVTAVTGLLAGIAPMLLIARADLTADLKAGAREGVYQRSAMRGAMLVVQGALCVVLLVGAGLFVRSLNQVRNVRLGYDVDPVLVVDLEMRGVTLDSARAVQLRQRLLDRARSTPGVRNASLQLGIPFWSTWSDKLYVAGIDTVGRLGRFDVSAVSAEYFATFGTRILRGRGVLDTDRAGAPLVMVVSQAMARTLWPSEDAIGKCVRIGADTSPCRNVVGVAEDIKSTQLSDEKEMYYYLPAEQFHPSQTGLFVRVAGDGEQYVEAVRRSLQREMPGAAYVSVTPFASIVGNEVRSWNLGASMFTAFGMLALALAAIGLYSVIAYNVVQRTHELGVRLALGAQRRDVLRLVVAEGVRVAVVAIAIGGAIAFAVAPRIGPLLFNVSPRDPAVYVTVAVTLLAVSMMASWLPASRASRVDPTRALRYE